MFIVEVIPVGRGIPTETLSYFSPRAFERGALVRINVRKSELPAIVTSSQEAFTMKAALRAATFSLRRLKNQEPQGRLSLDIIEVAEAMAERYASSLGSILYALLPKEVRDGSVPLPTEVEHDLILPISADKPMVFQDVEDLRFHEYERMIRESFAQGRSLLFVAPTSASVISVAERLGKGIENYTLLLHGGAAARPLKKAFSELSDNTHPLFIIATPAYATIARRDIGTVVVEYERSGSYVGKTRPYLDHREALESHALRTGRRFILAGSVIRSEVIYRLELGEAVPFREQPKRLEFDSALRVIEMKPDSDGGAAFTLFSPKLLEAITATLKDKRRVFLFSARRGLAPLVACIDCGEIFRDPNSGAPLALERRTRNGTEERWLISSVSGYHVRAPDLCPLCGSWRLRERGIGIQQVHDELRKHVDAPIILFDHLSAKTEKRSLQLLEQFYSVKRSVLIGTALTLPRLKHPVAMSAIVNMDALRAIPSWRQQEEMFAILMALREKTEDAVYVQTRGIDDIFDLVKRGQIAEFYASELGVRKEYRYPPYTHFIHLSWHEENDGPIKQMLAGSLKAFDISLYTSPHVGEANPVQYGLIRLPREVWPNKELGVLLRGLPPAIKIVIDPDRII